MDFNGEEEPMPAEASFLFHPNWLTVAEMLGDADRLAFYDALIRLGCRGEAYTGGNSGVNMALAMAAPSLRKSRARSIAGRLGGLAGKGVSRNFGNQNATKAKQKQNKSGDVGGNTIDARKTKAKSDTGDDAEFLYLSGIESSDESAETKAKQNKREREREREREKNLEKNLEKKEKFGERISMLPAEHAALVETFGAELVEREIAKADDWLLAKGRRQADYAAFLRNWLRKSAAQERRAERNGGNFRRFGKIDYDAAEAKMRAEGWNVID